jgi:hypothetical protein
VRRRAASAGAALAGWVTAAGGRAWALVDGRDLLFGAGVGSLAYGSAQVFEPAGWIVAGALLVWLSTRGASPAPAPPKGR